MINININLFNKIKQINSDKLNISAYFQQKTHDKCVFKSSEALIAKYPEDEKYREDLAEEINKIEETKVSTDDLKSVMGPQELKDILKNELKPEKELKPKNFSLGKDYANVNNGIFSVNLHMHTNHSDEVMTVENLLNQTENYAEYRLNTCGKNDPVIVAITDHDMLEGAQEAIKILSEHPKKYKNIRFVPGIEFNAKHKIDKKDYSFKPKDASTYRQMEIIGYCINPFNKELNEFMNTRRQKNEAYLNKLLTENVNKWEGEEKLRKKI